MNVIGLKLWSLLAVALFGIFTAGNAHAEKRVALVIGNGAYQHTQALDNPANDANLIATVLRAKKFEVLLHTDLNQKGMKRAISEFTQKLRQYGQETTGLIYYAGHGVQVGGLNFLLPTDARVETEADVDIESVEANAIMRGLDRANNRLNIIILDACRNNPFRSQFRSASRGLARMDAPTGSLIAYSTAPGQVAADGEGSNSPYTQELARQLNEPGIKIEEVFKRVRRTVHSQSNGKQTPWISTSLLGDFYVSAPAEEGKKAAPQQPLDVIYWQTVRNSNNAATLSEFLKRFPHSIFSSTAKAKLRQLRLLEENKREKNQLATTGTLDAGSAGDATDGFELHAAHSIFIKHGKAFIRDRGTEIRLLESLKSGRRLFLKMKLKNGTELEEVYSLSGVTAAWQRMSQNCHSLINRRGLTAASSKSDRTYKKWLVASSSEICFVASEPIRRTPRRGQVGSTWMYISSWPKDNVKEEISWLLGKNVDPSARVTFRIE